MDPSTPQQRIEAHRQALADAGNYRGATVPLAGSFQERALLRPCACQHCGGTFEGIHGEIGCARCAFQGAAQFAGALWEDEGA